MSTLLETLEHGAVVRSLGCRVHGRARPNAWVGVLLLLGIGELLPLSAELLGDLAEGEVGVLGDDLGALGLAEEKVGAGGTLGLVVIVVSDQTNSLLLVILIGPVKVAFQKEVQHATLRK